MSALLIILNVQTDYTDENDWNAA